MDVALFGVLNPGSSPKAAVSVGCRKKHDFGPFETPRVFGFFGGITQKSGFFDFEPQPDPWLNPISWHHLAWHT